MKMAWPLGYLTALAADGAPTYFKVVMRLDGTLRVRPIENFRPTRHHSRLIALHPDLVFCRHAHFIPRNRAELEAIAPSLFPFEINDTVYACGFTERRTPTFFAMPTKDISLLITPFLPASAVLVAPPIKNDLELAINDRLNLGDISDLSNTSQKMISPAAVVMGTLLTVLIALLFGCVIYYQIRNKTAETELLQQLNYAEIKATPLIKARQISARMAADLHVINNFSHSAQSEIVSSVSNFVLRQVPSGDYLEGLEFDGRRLVVVGFSNAPDFWLGGTGLKFEPARTFKLPHLDRFEATAPLSVRP